MSYRDFKIASPRGAKTRYLLILPLFLSVGFFLLLSAESTPKTISTVACCQVDKQETVAKVLLRDIKIIQGRQKMTLNIEDPNLLWVEFHIDGKLIATDRESPYECSYDFGEAPLEHEVAVIGYYPKETIYQAPSPPEQKEEEALPPREPKGLEVKITSPQPDTYLSGKVTISAEVSTPPGTSVERVEFYIDQKLVFTDREPPYQFSWDAGQEFNRKIIEVVAYNSEGEKGSDLIVSRDLEGYLFEARVNLVTLDVTVTDKRNKYISGLDEDDFRVYEDGALQAITHFTREERPLVIGLLLDSSGSMEGLKIVRAKEGAKKFIRTLKDDEEAFFIDFDSEVKVLQDFTSDKGKLLTAIDSTDAEGATALNKALWEGIKKLEDKTGRKAIILLSDGYDTVQEMTEEQVLEAAKRAEVKIYSIGIIEKWLTLPAPFRRQTPFEEKGLGEIVLKSLSDWTGGEAFFPQSVSRLDEIYLQIARELRSQYALGYASTNKGQDGSWRTIKVELSDKDLKARTKKGYYAPGKQQPTEKEKSSP
ncbi:MAG: VWA domain-containing protein [Candidatus Aminicenantes bacterium]|nr:VWA domain-containing protein [Candidatus Aminicenantes bacterium]